MEILYILEISSVLIIIIYYGASFGFLMQRETIKDRIVQYASYYVYDQYKLKIKKIRNKVKDIGSGLFRYFVPEPYIMIEQQPYDTTYICNDLPDQAIPKKSVLIIDDDIPVINIPSCHQQIPLNSISSTIVHKNKNKEKWVMLEFTSGSLPNESRFEEFELLYDDKRIYETM